VTFAERFVSLDFFEVWRDFMFLSVNLASKWERFQHFASEWVSIRNKTAVKIDGYTHCPMKLSSGQANVTSLSVLVVEDQADLRELIVRMLHDAGVWSTTTASNGQEAYAIARRSYFDVVFTDLMMPEMNGVELAERLRLGNAPILFAVTSGIEASLKHDSAKVRALFDGWVDKPVTREKIAEAIERAAELLIARRSSRKRLED
jgi:CheY-like chemotaxis protein